MTKKLQIGVMGSAADLGYSEKAGQAAFEIGRLIAVNGAVLVFGAEKDGDSLSTSAMRGAKSVGGLTVGITYGGDRNVWGDVSPDVVIATGLVRGGGRETALVLSCDAIIAIGGGSGTLNEMVVAYQAKIPIAALVGFGGWADRLAGQYFDERKKGIVVPAYSPEEAVAIALDNQRNSGV